MSRTIVSLYQSKCDFNNECTILSDALNSITGGGIKARIYMVTANIDHNDTNNMWTGFVKTITTSVKSEIIALKKDMMVFKKE